MKKLTRGSISDDQIIGTANLYTDYYQRGQPDAVEIIKQMLNGMVPSGISDIEVHRMFCQYVAETMGDIWLNDEYQVCVHPFKHPVYGNMVHLSIKNLEKTHFAHDWRKMMQIKNQLVGDDCEAVEIYPPESRLVDNANQYHLWVFNNPEFTLDIGWSTRMVTNNAEQGCGQRSFDEEATSVDS